MTNLNDHDTTKSRYRPRLDPAMLKDDTDRDPLESVGAEYAERCRLGERVSIEEYAERFPDLATEIRELFPTIQAMEQLNAKRAMESGLRQQGIPAQLGDYRVIGEIARGGMGVVYEAEQISLARRVAIKVLPQRTLRGTRDVIRFEREAQTAAKLHHSNIVPVFGVGHDEGHHYIVMQLIRGVGLDEILTETKRLVTGSVPADPITSGRSSTVKRSAVGLLESELRNDTVKNGNTETLLSDSSTDVGQQEPRKTHIPVPSLLQIQSAVDATYYKNVARIGLQAAEALQYAHAHNTLHRDVKPGNLLLDSEGCVWMADFGLAKAMESDSVTNSGDVVGTLAYVAPERFRGETTSRSDIYSLGLTLHEMLTLQKAFTGEDRMTIMNQVANERLPSPRKINPDVPRDLETIVMKAAAHDPADRYSTAGEMAADLSAFLTDRPILARRLSKVEHAVRWCRRNRSTAAMLTAVALLLAAAFGATVAGYFHSERQRQQSDVTTKLAVGVLDEIYNRFSSSDLNVRVADSDDSEESEGFAGSPALPLSRDVAFMLDKMLPVYDEFSNQANDSAFVAVKSISAIGRVGDIHRRLGELDEAKRSYEEAIKRLELLPASEQDTPSVRLESARIHNGLGVVLLQADRDDEKASMHHQKAISTIDREQASDEESFELARSLYLLYVSERRNRKRRAADDQILDRAKGILSRLQEAHPGRPEYRFLFARCLLANRSDCGANGALNDEQAMAINMLETLVTQSPENPDYQFELGDTYRSIEYHEYKKHKVTGRDASQLSKSISRLRRGIALTANLEIRHPNIPQYNLLKKRLHHLLATALRDQGDLVEAADEYQRALEKQKLLLSQSREPHRHQFWLHHLELEYGKVLIRLERNAEAGVLLRASLAGLEALMDYPETKASRHQQEHTEKTLAEACGALAVVEEVLGDAKRALELSSMAKEIVD